MLVLNQPTNRRYSIPDNGVLPLRGVNTLPATMLIPLFLVGSTNKQDRAYWINWVETQLYTCRKCKCTDLKHKKSDNTETSCNISIYMIFHTLHIALPKLQKFIERT